MGRFTWRRYKPMKTDRINSWLNFTKQRNPYRYTNVARCLISADHWTSFPIYSIQNESHNTMRFRLKLPDTNDRFGLPVASCVTIRGLNKDNKEVIRPYTPVSDSALQGFIEFVIKIYENGEMTQYLSNLTIDDKIEIKGPWMKIKYPFAEKSNLAMISGGTGITPMIQVLKEMSLHSDIDLRNITLLNANITKEDRLCQSDLMSIKACLGDRLQIWDIIEKSESNAEMIKSWNPNIIKIGRIDKDLLRKYLPEPDDDTLVMVCGPDPMINAICGPKEFVDDGPPKQGEIDGMLNELGYNQDMVFKF